jgi:catechol 2,3-dioxygenase-like lactoylglutathione lyase family enzyme
MLENYAALGSIPVTDVDRAKKWYSEKLGLEPVEDNPEYVEYNTGGSRFMLFRTRAAAGAGHTVISFEVDDVEKVVEWLQGRGVVFEEYDMPDLKTVNGIATVEGFKGGWFKDVDNNILAVGQRI